MGPASYDLVSFLLDRQPCPPFAGGVARSSSVLSRRAALAGLGAIDPDEFAQEFRLMTIQRGLKATGTFSYQTAVYGRGAAYQHFIEPTLQIVLQAIDWLERFPTLRRMLKERINSTSFGFLMTTQSLASTATNHLTSTNFQNTSAKR